MKDAVKTHEEDSYYISCMTYAASGGKYRLKLRFPFAALSLRLIPQLQPDGQVTNFNYEMGPESFLQKFPRFDFCVYLVIP